MKEKLTRILDRMHRYNSDQMAMLAFGLDSSVALLVVSDNSATGAALVGRAEEEQEKYDIGRLKILPDIILATAKL